MVSVPVRTWPTMPTRLAFMFFSACRSWPISSFECTSTVCVKSPAATLSARRKASFNEREIVRIIQKPINPASTTPNTMATMEILRTSA